MKKVLIAAALILASFSAQAQTVVDEAYAIRNSNPNMTLGQALGQAAKARKDSVNSNPVTNPTLVCVNIAKRAVKANKLLESDYAGFEKCQAMVGEDAMINLLAQMHAAYRQGLWK